MALGGPKGYGDLGRAYRRRAWRPVLGGTLGFGRQSPSSKLQTWIGANEMRHLVKIAGLCLAVVFVVSAALTSTASAAHWLVCLEAATGSAATRWETSQCSTAVAGGAWEWSELDDTEPVKVITQTLTLTDTKVPVVGSTTAICAPGSGEGAGSIGPGAFDRVNTFTIKEPAKNCRGTGGCKVGGIEAVNAVNMPWQTELIEIEGKISDIITGTNNGEPGWEIKCEDILGGKIADLCFTAGPGKAERTGLLNVATGAELLVLGTFEKANKTNCTQGGAGSGEVGGSLALLLTSGAALRASLK
jgi:hypothetical protein